MLRRSTGVEVQFGLEISDGAFAGSEELEDPDPHGMAEDSEELRLDHVHRI
jgi:hypothetical protein